VVLNGKIWQQVIGNKILNPGAIQPAQKFLVGLPFQIQDIFGKIKSQESGSS